MPGNVAAQILASEARRGRADAIADAVVGSQIVGHDRVGLDTQGAKDHRAHEAGAILPCGAMDQDGQFAVGQAGENARKVGRCGARQLAVNTKHHGSGCARARIGAQRLPQPRLSPESTEDVEFDALGFCRSPPGVGQMIAFAAASQVTDQRHANAGQQRSIGIGRLDDRLGSVKQARPHPPAVAGRLPPEVAKIGRRRNPHWPCSGAARSTAAKVTRNDSVSNGHGSHHDGGSGRRGLSPIAERRARSCRRVPPAATIGGRYWTDRPPSSSC